MVPMAQMKAAATARDTERAVEELIAAMGEDDEARGTAAIAGFLRALAADLRRLSEAVEALAGRAP